MTATGVPSDNLANTSKESLDSSIDVINGALINMPGNTLDQIFLKEMSTSKLLI